MVILHVDKKSDIFTP